MEGISEELQNELMDDVMVDAQRLTARMQAMSQRQTHPAGMERYRDLEYCTYITEQIRLKLRLLGAPRIDR